MTTRLTLAALLTSMVAMAGAAVAQDAERWKQTTRVTGGSEFDRSIQITGASATLATLYNLPSTTWRLVTSVTKATGFRQHLLLFSDSYEGRGWRFWKFADTDAADSLKVIELQRNVGSCSGYSGCLHHENVAIVLPEPLLEKRQETGLRVRLRGTGSSQDTIVALTGDQIKDQLAASRAESDKLSTPKPPNGPPPGAPPPGSAPQP